MNSNTTGIRGIGHIGIAVPTIDDAANWLNLLPVVETNDFVSESEMVRVLVVTTLFCNFEFLEPLSDKSPISQYLLKNPRGGIHHICFSTDCIADDIPILKDHRIRSITRNSDASSVHQNRICFLSPLDLTGVLVELEEEKKE